MVMPKSIHAFAQGRGCKEWWSLNFADPGLKGVRPD